jgi:DNA-3-methyladenine glycosylase
VIFGPPGHAYVYLSYGIHDCLNIVAEPEGSPGCVLIRALEPVAGIDLMQRRRGLEKIEDLCSGPGKLTRALGITLRHNGADVTRGPLTIHAPARETAVEIATSSRIGLTKNPDWPLRFFIQGSRFVSGAKLKRNVETDDFSRVRHPGRGRF